MEADFEDIPQEQFRLRLRPHALELYRQQWPGCTIVDLREDDSTHVLDEHYGIDTVIQTAEGAPLSIQEKYRKHRVIANPRFREVLACPDFTQEWMNAAGTNFEEPGEWFHLQADLYFYGWASKQEDGFVAWLLINVPAYKRIVIDAGGMEAIGSLRQNNSCGRATFYCIPISRIRDAVVDFKMPKRYLNYP